MIIDSIKNVGFYSGMSEHLKDVARFLNENALEDIQAGKYVLNDSVFYYCFEYTTKEEVAAGECHRTYCDVHVMINGEEEVGLSVLSDVTDVGVYDGDNDYSLVKADFSYTTLLEGCFAVFFPHEGHATGRATNGVPQGIKKLVFKVPASSVGQL